ncbi:metallophosphoesterase family protein [Terrihabitans sp. B22-R8]|uniref:metallophosphoesterase family protein n=1 Tax=Terrihabitans sp. B22-R8 TaxID=3425128 RepID=UPI00403C5EB0
MTRLVHISDLHFGRTDPEVVDALRAEIRADPPDMVVCSGDLTQVAAVQEFKDAKDFLDSLGVPVFAIPGNHDIPPTNLWERFTDPYKRWRTYYSEVKEPVWCNDEVALLGVNTARRFGWHWNWAHGRVTKNQLEALENRLAALPKDVVRIVVAHHPFLPPDKAPDTKLVGRVDKALALFARHDVKLILAGHLHRAYARVATAGGAGSVVVVQAGTATSTRLRDEANAYNRFTVSAGRVSMDTRVWNEHGWETGYTSANLLAPQPDEVKEVVPTETAGTTAKVEITGSAG